MRVHFISLLLLASARLLPAQTSPELWETLGPRPTTAHANSGLAVASSGAEVYATESGRFWRHDVATGQWTRMPDVAFPWQWPVLVSDGGDLLFAAAGNPPNVPARMMIYSITAALWTEGSVLATHFGGVTSLLYQDGHVYAWYDHVAAERLYRYSVAADEWRAMSPPPEPSGQAAIASGETPDLLYVFSNAAGDRSVLWTYSIGGNAWNSTVTPALPPFQFWDESAAVVGTPRGILAWMLGGTTPWTYRYPTMGSPAGAWEQAAPPIPIGPGASLAGHYAGTITYGMTMDGRFWRRTTSRPPELPSGAAQKETDGSVAIAMSGTTRGGGFLAEARVFDPDGDSVLLEIQAAPTGAAIETGTLARTALVPSGSIATVLLDGLAPATAYFWRARAVDRYGIPSAGWAHLGTADSSEADFRTPANILPEAKSAAHFRASNGSDLLSRGFRALLVDVEGSPVALEVEVRSAGAGFTGEPTAASEPVPSGSEASVILPLATGAYEWRYRALEKTSFRQAGPWQRGAGFRVDPLGSLNTSSGCLAAPSSSTLALAAIVLVLMRRRWAT